MINANNVLATNNTNNSTTDNKENTMNTEQTEQITLTLNNEQLAKIYKLANKMNKSISDTFAQVVDRGLYDVNYRWDRMKQELQSAKEYRAWKKANSGK